jgi:hypothetical protein
MEQWYLLIVHVLSSQSPYGLSWSGLAYACPLFVLKLTNND